MPWTIDPCPKRLDAVLGGVAKHGWAQHAAPLQIDVMQPHQLDAPNGFPSIHSIGTQTAPDPSPMPHHHA